LAKEKEERIDQDRIVKSGEITPCHDRSAELQIVKALK